MANLIITIVSIALVAVAAVMAIFYGGVAFENAQYDADANAIMNEATQILQAARMWDSDNMQTDISGMGAAGSQNIGISILIQKHYLSQWPSIGNIVSGSTTVYAFNSAGTTSNSTYDSGIYSIGGYSNSYSRTLFAYNG